MQPETENLKPYHTEDRSEYAGHSTKRLSIELDNAHQTHEVGEDPNRHPEETRNEEPFIRARDEHHPQAAPSVTECAQFRFAFSFVEVNRPLRGLQSSQASIDGQ